jgi:signal transduction histidine kinase
LNAASSFTGDPPALFRIAREALANVALHAGTCRASIDVRPVNACERMKIRDDGNGFDTRGRRAEFGGALRGLPGMKERAEMVGSSLRIESRSREGTTVWIEVPRRESGPADRSEPNSTPAKKSP